MDDDFLGENVEIGKVVGVFEAFVSKPDKLSPRKDSRPLISGNPKAGMMTRRTRSSSRAHRLEKENRGIILALSSQPSAIRVPPKPFLLITQCSLAEPQKTKSPAGMIQSGSSSIVKAVTRSQARRNQISSPKFNAE